MKLKKLSSSKKSAAQKNVVKRINIEKMDPEEWTWRKRRAERRGEI